MTHFLVVDLEATCCDDGRFPRDEMEIIEIGAVMVCARSHQTVSEFQSFICPVRNPELTDFCRTLTKIRQSDVDSAPDFASVLKDFVEWANRFRTFEFCSWGDYDRKQLAQDCLYHQVEYPFDSSHINLKAQFATMNHRRRRMGVPAALSSVGLSFSGTHHRGIDDARNIALLIPSLFPVLPDTDAHQPSRS
jgi:3'-5' exoribonuclease 1